MNFRNSVLLALATGAMASPGAPGLYTDDKAQQLSMWKGFVEEYNRNYPTEKEELERFAIFMENMKIADQRNSEDTALHGITKFSDMSQAEFRSVMLTTDLDEFEPSGNFTEVLDTTEPPASGSSYKSDWAGKYTTPIKDQGHCGSCWAFSVTEQLESDYIRHEGGMSHEKILSPQQLTDCVKDGDYGCGGGSSTTAMKYTYDGVELESDYKYTSGSSGKAGSCKAKSSHFKVYASSYSNVADESSMAKYVGETGTLKISVNSDHWSSYKSGILTSCGDDSTNHAVQIVGVNTGDGYWKVRNSWGEDFGEKGYIRLSYGHNTCYLAHKGGYHLSAHTY